MAQLFSVRTFISVLLLLLPGAAFAGGGHQLPLYPESPLRRVRAYWISNSMIMVWLAALIIVAFCRVATKKMALVPSGVQNLAEWLVEGLYDFFGNILGEHLVKRTFWFFGATFLLILLSTTSASFPVLAPWDDDAHGHFKGLLRGG